MPRWQLCIGMSEQTTNLTAKPAALRRRSRVGLSVAAAAVVLGLGGWAGVAAAGSGPARPAPSPHVQKWGEVTGTMQTGGGVAPGRVHGIPGKVTLTAADGHVLTVEVGKSGDFSIRVPVGTYRVVGYSPDITGMDGKETPMRAYGPTVVTAGHTTTVELGLFVP
jgi:hypothetical protein